jgi:two-component system, NarL family, nitrate/nitrite response regulator NarL
MTSCTSRVFLAAAVRMYEEGLGAMIGDDPRFQLVGTASSRHAMLGAIAALDAPPDVVLIDLGRAEGVSAVRALGRTAPQAGVVALAVGDDDEEVVAFAEAGAVGLVPRESSVAQLTDLIESVACGGSPCAPRIGAVLLRRIAARAAEARSLGDPRPLTLREREVARLIDRGLSNKEIGTRLRIQLPTVKNHVHSILEKVDVSRRSEAVAVLRSRGFLD